MSTLKTTLNGAAATIHVFDRTKEQVSRYSLCFEYALLDQGKPHHVEYANCVDVKTNEQDAKKIDALLIARAVEVVAAAQVEFDKRFEVEKVALDEYIERVDEKLARKAEVEAEIAARL